MRFDRALRTPLAPEALSRIDSTTRAMCAARLPLHALHEKIMTIGAPVALSSVLIARTLYNRNEATSTGAC
ncbi:hypothetical protein BN2476_520074 [Paraburkholderia piptadeniae]|uniref:Uncharacterized protein n=1 Tax=Paraburkholderia piptadeniae TaxID=1701573 RepID=A0A1N7SH06_9BURK|nr:hypothetical protein BN2476_520074 [Paraburkholderia piptadeniae]